MQHSLLYDWWPYVLLFRCGGSVESAEEEDDLMTQLMNHDNVYRAAPVFAWVCLTSGLDSLKNGISYWKKFFI